MGLSQSTINIDEEKIVEETIKREAMGHQRQQIDALQREARQRDAGLLTAHLPKVNPLTKFTVAERTGIISPPTRGMVYDPRGLPRSVIENRISQTPAFLQQSDRSESYLDNNVISQMRNPRQVQFA